MMDFTVLGPPKMAFPLTAQDVSMSILKKVSFFKFFVKICHFLSFFVKICHFWTLDVDVGTL